MADLRKTLERVRLVREDVQRDVAQVDRTPFTPKGVGETFGILFAQVEALAKCIEELVEAHA